MTGAEAPEHADRLPFTGSEEADRLLVSDPMALLIGFTLDQQVPVPKAFSGPAVLRERIGTLDPRRIAEMDPAELDAAFRERPALHRFPSAMAQRVREVARAVVDDYDGDAARLWTEARDGADLQRRLSALPGFGEMKVQSLIAVLVKRLGIRPPGWQSVVPDHPTLGDVDSEESLRDYQAAKRARKQQLREERGG